MVKKTIKKIVRAVFLSLVVIGLLGSLNIANFIKSVIAQDNSAAEEMTLYISTGCPHCAEVERFLKKHNLEEDIKIKNITEDEGVAEEYSDFVEENDISSRQQGTPTLVSISGGEEDDFEWVVGDEPIIEFLAEKYDIELENESAPIGDYLLLGIGAVIVSFVIGYGIVNVVNGKKKD
jgi:glutaredoxin